MKNLVIYIIAVLLFPNLLSGMDETRYSLSGRVTDSDGKALPGATVLLEDTFLGTSTGHGGDYIINGIKEGVYTVRISFVGYSSYNESITVDGDVMANFSLSPSTVVAEEIVVKGSRAGRNTPVTYTTISGETLKKVNMAQDLPYILSMVPSLVETSESGAGVGYTNFRIRGSDPSRINVTIDGIPLNDAESQQVFWVDMPDLAGSISDIQVQRGVGTSTNGAGSFGASVNLMTDNPSTVPYAEFSTVYGSYSTVKGSAKIGTGLLGDRFMMDLRLSGLHSDGYVDRSSSNLSSIFATGVYNLSKGRLKVNFTHGREVTGISWWGVPYDSLTTNRTFNPAGMYTNEDGDTAFYHNQVDDYTQTHFHGIFNWQFSSNLHLNVAGHFTRGLGYYEQYKEDQYLADYGLPQVRIEGFYPVFITQTDLVRRKWMYNYFEGVLFNLHYNKGRTELTLGGGANRYLGDHFGRIVWMRIAGKTEKDYRWYLNGATKDELNIYGKINHNLGRGFTLFGDLQYRFISYRMSGYDDSLLDLYMNRKYNFVNPKAGIYYRITSNHETYLSVAVAHREPTRANFTDAVSDSSAVPQPERLIDLEAGYKFSLSNSAVGINFYYMAYHDQLVPTGELSNVGYPIMTNVPSSYRAGVEITASVNPVRRVSIDGNLTLSRNIIRDFTEYYIDYNTTTMEEVYMSKSLGDVNIAYSPGVVTSGDVAYSPVDGMEIHLIGKYVGYQYFDNTSNSVRSLNPYFVTNMRVDQEFSLKKGTRIGVQLQVNNLFNSMYVSNAYGGNWYTDGVEYSWASYFPQAGINYLARLFVRF